MDLPIFVEVLQPLQDLLQDGGDAGLVQHSGLVFAARNDMLDDVQNWAWETGRDSVSMQRKSPGTEWNVCVPVLLANVSAVLQGKTQHNRIVRIFPSTIMKLNYE